MDSEALEKLLGTLSSIDERLKAVEGKPKKKNKNKEDDKFNLLSEKLDALLEARANNGGDALEVMYQEVMDNALKMNGFEDFLSSDDDFGRNRKEELEKLPPKERLNAIKTLSARYAEASPDVGQAQTAAVKKAIKKQESFEEKYQEIKNEKFRNKGSVAEFNDELDRLIVQEVEALKQMRAS